MSHYGHIIREDDGGENCRSAGHPLLGCPALAHTVTVSTNMILTSGHQEGRNTEPTAPRDYCSYGSHCVYLFVCIAPPNHVVGFGAGQITDSFVHHVSSSQKHESLSKIFLSVVHFQWQEAGCGPQQKLRKKVEVCLILNILPALCPILRWERTRTKMNLRYTGRCTPTRETIFLAQADSQGSHKRSFSGCCCGKHRGSQQIACSDSAIFHHNDPAIFRQNKD